MDNLPIELVKEEVGKFLTPMDQFCLSCTAKRYLCVRTTSRPYMHATVFSGNCYLGAEEAQFIPSEANLCPDSRDCNGNGTCDPNTGKYICVGNWWGVNCDTACECKNALCHCTFPYYGLTCSEIRVCCE